MASQVFKIEGSAIVVVKTLLTGGAIVFEAYEPSIGGYASTSHSSLYRIGDTVYGSVASRRITDALDKLPARSDERYNAVHAFIEQNKRESYAAIVGACPEAANGNRDGLGRIELWPVRS